MSFVYVALGGAVGTVLRYALSRMAVSLDRGQELPWWTMTANVLGSAILGFVFVWGEGKQIFGMETRLLLGTGMMGGFTTYSTFNLETLRMVEEGEIGRALFYVGATIFMCLAAGYAGLSLARVLR